MKMDFGVQRGIKVHQAAHHITLKNSLEPRQTPILVMDYANQHLVSKWPVQAMTGVQTRLLSYDGVQAMQKAAMVAGALHMNTGYHITTGKLKLL